jgi:hypothetical protein
MTISFGFHIAHLISTAFLNLLDVRYKGLEDTLPDWFSGE